MIAWIWSHHLHLQWKFKWLAGQVHRDKHCWVMSANFFSKTEFECLPLLEGDEIESRLPFKIFYNLSIIQLCCKTLYHGGPRIFNKIILPLDFLISWLPRLFTVFLVPTPFLLVMSLVALQNKMIFILT